MLEPDTAVTVIAAPLERDGEIVLGTPVDGALLVSRGSPEQVARSSAFMTWATVFLGLLALGFGLTRLRRAGQMHADFAARA